MRTGAASSLLDLSSDGIEQCFDKAPFAFQHGLHLSGLFDPASLHDLAGRYADHPGDYFVAASAPEAGATFYSVPRSALDPASALAAMDGTPCRVLLKRPEQHDSRFRQLLDTLLDEVIARRAELSREQIQRIQGSVFISSAATTTPFHFDPEVAFFCQIAGDKEYHVYEPGVVTEDELERFYKRGQVDIGQVALEGRDPAQEHVFNLRPGDGFHQPQNAPHWVRTGASLSISYSFVFETRASQVQSRARAFNYYGRRAGLTPAAPGVQPLVDGAKARAMSLLAPVKQAVGRTLRH